MKILFIQNKLKDYRIPLLERIGKKHNLIVISTRKDKQISNKYFQHIILPGKLYFNKFALSKKLRKYLKKTKYDLVIMNDPHVFDTYSTYFIAKNKFILWSETCDFPRRKLSILLEPLIKLIIRNSRATIASGTKSKEYLLKKGAKKVFLAPDTAINYKVKKKIKLPKGKKILYVGRLTPYKGVDILIKAFNKLNPKATLLIAGQGQEENKLKRLANNKVIFLGQIDKEHIGSLYKQSDVFVLPTTFRNNDSDCWGLVVNEAMYHGNAIISTDAAGCSYDLIKDNGFQIKNNNIKELRNALKKLLENDKLLKKFQNNSKKLIKKYNYDNMVKGFLDAIKYYK